jgi:hypothetical protein
VKPVPNVVEGVTDRTFAAPAGKDYKSLPVAVAGKELVSRWTPDDVERKLIVDGGDIWVSLLSNVQPPMYVSGEKPIVRDMGKGVLLVGYPSHTADSEGDPYLNLAKEIRDKVQAIIDDANGGGGLGCLINCTSRKEDEVLAWFLDDALACLRTAAHLMQCAVERIEDEEMSGEGKCRLCGCTDTQACPGGCYWVDDPEEKGDLCSRCLEEHYPEVAAKRMAAHPDEPYPLCERVEGEMDMPAQLEAEGEKTPE